MNNKILLLTIFLIIGFMFITCTPPRETGITIISVNPSSVTNGQSNNFTVNLEVVITHYGAKIDAKFCESSTGGNCTLVGQDSFLKSEIGEDYAYQFGFTGTPDSTRPHLFLEMQEFIDGSYSGPLYNDSIQLTIN